MNGLLCLQYNIFLVRQGLFYQKKFRYSLLHPQGNNVFDDFGKKALFGRCFMFMDAQQPEIIRIVQKII